MALSINLQITGLDKVRATLNKLASDQLKQATANALNDTAFAARKAIQTRVSSVFDRPSPYIVKSVQVTKATSSNLEAWVGPASLGGRGTDPQKILQAHASGGPRRRKPFEKALQAAGILPASHFAVIPTSPYPGSSDGRGGLKVQFVQRLLTAMVGSPRQRLGATGKRTARYKGQGRENTGAGVFFVVGKDGRNKLPPGIWAHPTGSRAKPQPVLLFVKAASYGKSLDMAEIARAADLQGLFEKKMRYHIRKIVGE